MRIACYLLAIALFAASAMEASIAEEVGSGTRDGGGLVQSAPGGTRPLSGTDDATKFDKRNTVEGRGDSVKVPTGEGASGGTQTPLTNVNSNNSGGGLEGIDTRMMVQSHRLGRRDKTGEVNAKARLLSPSHLQQSRRLTPATSDHVTRNAIGLPLARHERLERRDGEHRDVPNALPRPGTGTITHVGNASGGLAKIQGGLDRPPIPHPGGNSIGGPFAANHGTINGTGRVHYGSGPAGIGGPAKSVAGISGTMIRPKH